MYRETIDSWLERGILGLVLGILVFAPLAFGSTPVWPFIVIQAITVLTMILWMARLWVGGKTKILWPPICWVAIAFVIYAIVRYAQADIEYVARKELMRVLVYAFLFFIILNNLHRQESTQMIGLTLVFLAMTISFYAVWQFFLKEPKIWNMVSPYPGRGSGTFICPNNLAGYLEMILPLGFCYVLVGRLSHVTKILTGYASVVVLVGIGASLSRGGWLSTGLTLLVMCGLLLAQRDYRVQGFVLLGVIVLVCALVIPRMQSMQARIERMVESGKADDMRFALWRPAIEIWHDNFWWGAGPGHFDYRFPQYRSTPVQLRPIYAHNDYLNTLADWGITGACLVAAAFVALFWGVLKTWKFTRGGTDDFARKKSSRFAFTMGASLGLIAILAHSMTDFNMHIPANAILAITLMALLTSQWRFATERFWFRANAGLKVLGTVILLAGAVYLSNETARSAREWHSLHRAEIVGEPPNHYGNARLEALKNAFAADPMNFNTVYEIGYCYQMRSFWNIGDYKSYADEAIEWYRRGIVLDKWSCYNWLGIGLCLDWTGAKEDSDPYFEKANELDPNSYYVTARIGWHYIQKGDLAAARTWLTRSRQLQWVHEDNTLAYDYLPIVEQRLREQANAQK